MDGRRFDDIARALATGITRRRMLGSTLASAGATLLGPLRRSQARQVACATDGDCAADQQCVDGVCQPRDSSGGTGGDTASGEIGCCTCKGDRGCQEAANGAACKTVCGTKTPTFDDKKTCQDSRKCVAKTGSEVPGESACVPQWSDFGLQRQLAGMVYAAPRPPDTKREGYLRIENTLTYDLKKSRGLDEAQEAGLANLGWVGAYRSTIGVPAGSGDPSETSISFTFTAHVLHCEPAGIAPGQLYELANLVPEGAADDGEIPQIKGSDFSEGYSSEKDGMLYVGAVGMRGNVLFGIALNATDGTSLKDGRKLIARVGNAAVQRIPGPAEADFWAQNRTAANVVVLPDRVKNAGRASLAATGYGGVFFSASGGDPLDEQFQRARMVDFSVTEMVRLDSSFGDNAKFTLSVLKHADAGAAGGSYDSSMQTLAQFPGFGGAITPIERPVPATGEVTRSIVFFHLPSFQGGIASISKAGDINRETFLLGEGIPIAATAQDAVTAHFGQGIVDEFLAHSDSQSACLAASSAGDYAAACALLSGADSTRPPQPTPSGASRIDCQSGEDCEVDQQCCGGTCCHADLYVCCGSGSTAVCCDKEFLICQEDGSCKAGPNQRCESTIDCASGLSCCAEACTDTLSSSTDCGACGTACPAGRSCEQGACQAPAETALTFAPGPAGVVNTAGVLLSPIDYKGIDRALTVLDIGWGTYYPSAKSVPGIPKEIRDRFGSFEDYLDAKYGRRDGSGAFRLAVQCGAFWLPPGSSVEEHFAGAQRYLSSIATETFPATGELRGYQYFSGFLPNYKLGLNLPAMDLTAGVLPTGSLMLVAFRPGNVPAEVERDLALMRQRASSPEAPGDELGRRILHFTGATAATFASRWYSRLDGRDIFMFGADQETRERQSRRNDGQHCVLHQDQNLDAGRKGATYRSSFDVRSFGPGNESAAEAWRTGYQAGIQQDFGVPLTPITEGDEIPGSNGSTFYFIDRPLDDGRRDVALLGTAQVDWRVAVMRIGATLESSASDFGGWFFRNGGLDIAMGSRAVMTRQVALLAEPKLDTAFLNPGWGFAVPDEFRFAR